MLIRIALLTVLFVAPFTARAEEPAEPAAAAMPCTGPDDKGCCGGACTEAQAAAGEAKAGDAECPCKKAAKAAAAAKAAEAAKDAQ